MNQERQIANQKVFTGRSSPYDKPGDLSDFMSDLSPGFPALGLLEKGNSPVKTLCSSVTV
jgi:hypothetical protein